MDSSSWVGWGRRTSREARTPWVLKLDPDGELEWERRIGGDRDAVFSSVMQTRDGGFACAGTLHETA